MNRNDTIADFLNADIAIQSIRDIWTEHSRFWYRPNKLPRPCNGLLYFYDGSIEYQYDDFEFTVTAGQVLRLPGNLPYSGRKLTEYIHYICIDFVSDVSDYLTLPLPFTFSPRNNEDIAKKFASLEEEWRTPSIGRLLKCREGLYRLFTHLIQDNAENQYHYDESSRIMQYREYIRHNFGNSEFRISDMAAHFYISETHLRRIFASELGMSPTQLLTKVRIDCARRMLASNCEQSVAEIAALCGYASYHYFYEVFRKTVGFSPNEYRKSFR